MPRKAAIVTTILCLTATALVARARQDTVRVDVRLVNIYATVVDSSGRYVGGLKKDDFLVEEDGKRQTLTHFSQDQDTPISVGIVFDRSGSMINKLQTATDAVEHFVKTIHADDDIFLLTFNGELELAQNFTSDRTKLTKALRNIYADGSTALYDALVAGLERIKSGEHTKRALLLITDGEDTYSETTFPEVRQQIRESELLVYALGISPTSVAEDTPLASPGMGLGRGGGRDAVNMDVLRFFAADSGGRAYLISESMMGGKNNQFDRVLSQIAEELRSQYSLAYAPTHPDDGQYHNIRVSTRYGYHVRARQGYIAR